ncbi:MAG TPA: DUF1152 domain-containing protein [Candidatus Binatia bacterium]|nr:DUF1152 domain-containing protein [Candidatus Binatia bacterium]
MSAPAASLEDLLSASTHALVVGVGGGGDVVGALASARFLEFLGLKFTLGGVSWERADYDPVPGPRKLCEVRNVRALHPFAWMANRDSQTDRGAYFAESRMAAAIHREVLLVDINGGAAGVVSGLESALEHLGADLLIGIDVGGDSLATGHEAGLRSPLADSIMLAAWEELARRGRRALWGVFGYGSDGELTVDEIEGALSRVAAAGGLLGSWSLTPRIAAELDQVVQTVPTEASAIPLQCFRGATGTRKIRGGSRSLKLTPLTTLTFLMSPAAVVEAVARPARAVRQSSSLDEANEQLHAIGIRTELDYERSLNPAAVAR